MIVQNKYSIELREAIEIAQSIAKEHLNSCFTVGHLLKAILHNEVGIAAFLVNIGKDIHYLRDWADIRIEEAPKSSHLETNPQGDKIVKNLFEVADISRMKLGEKSLSPLAILITLCKPGIAFSVEQLKTFPLTENELLKAYIKDNNLRQAVGKQVPKNNGRGTSNKSFPSLVSFCIDKTEQAKLGKLDPIIGRNRETRNMIEILGRRIKPNAIIVGEPGVGKTALIEGFAQSLIAEEVPNNLKGATLYELDLGSLMAGASYKGEIEDRLKKILSELKQVDKAILFIDEIHMLLDSQSGLGGVANLLKPALARGEFTVIGATTPKEFRINIEADPAFSRRFERVEVEEPSPQVAIRMLKNVVSKYEDHHKISVTSEAVEEAVMLSKRYINEKNLPDSALDLMDTTMSALKLMVDTSSQELEFLEKRLGEVSNLEDLKWHLLQMKHRLSPILLGQLKTNINLSDFQEIKPLLEHGKKLIQSLKEISAKGKNSITAMDIAAVIANKTGIPIGKIQTEEQKKLLGMEEYLRKRVVGQNQALKVVSEAILESRADLKKPGLPVGSFFFSGPTGTGKTELAKSLAEFLFNDENALIRFDMSEFKESHSASLLYGAPPGYVGFKEGGLLVNKIRQNPYSIVLFDEIEKAHSSVYDVFLQILDEGRLTDKLGKTGDFSNAVILFTSNSGQEQIVQFYDQKGELPNSNELKELYKNLNLFRPEFIGRLDAIVPFAPISEEVVVLIFNIQLNGLKESLNRQGITIELSPEAEKSLAFKGYHPEFGARPIRAVIRTELRQPLSRLIISGELTHGDHVKISLSEDIVDIQIVR